MNGSMSLVRYVDVYLSCRDVSAIYAATLRAHARAFEAYCKREIKIDEITCDLVNEWLSELKARSFAIHSIDTQRRHLLAIWRSAFDDGLNNNPPLRVKKLRKPRLIVVAYSHAEIRSLLSAAAQLKGRHTNGNFRRDFWRAMIHAAYCTGLRRSDLLTIFKSQVQSDGTLHTIQHKTGYSVCVRLSPDALMFASRLKCPNGLLLPWPYRKDALAPRFKMICRKAGVNRGSLKWIRRSAASYAEKANPGAGARLLGHRGEQVFRQHYEDPTITRQNPFMPPPL